jgi:hypothetical protein
MTVSRICAHCGEVKHWRRFRVSLGGGRMRDEALCSKCRRYRRKRVLNRTDPEIVRQIKAVRSYCNTKTAMDRKYLRDNPEPNDSLPNFQREQQRIAIQQSNGWINFYSEISKHVINVLQETGTRLPINKIEGDPQLQIYYGVYDSKRARNLRYKKLGDLDSATFRRRDSK